MVERVGDALAAEARRRPAPVRYPRSCMSEGNVVVSIADPRAMFATVDNPRLTPVVDDVERRLRRVLRALVAT